MLIIGGHIQKKCLTQKARFALFRILRNDGNEFRGAADGTLAVGNARIEIERIAGVEEEFMLAEDDLDGAFENKIEFLSAVGDKAGFVRFVFMRLQTDVQGLHDASFEVVGERLEAVARIAIYIYPLPCADKGVVSHFRIFTGKKHGEIDVEQIGQLIKRADGNGLHIVFKVQIFASSALIKDGDARFKGLSGIGYYKDGGLYKYTVGESADYNAINRLRREIADKFPQAFVVAFKDGVRMDVNEAIREFKKK